MKKTECREYLGGSIKLPKWSENFILGGSYSFAVILIGQLS